jgi:heptose-I-phosphate ethanolaminephosphotransferase
MWDPTETPRSPLDGPCVPPANAFDVPPPLGSPEEPPEALAEETLPDALPRPFAARARVRDLAARVGRGVHGLRWLLAADLFLLSPALIYTFVVRPGGWRDPVALWTLATSVLWLVGLQVLARRPARFLVAALPLAVATLADLFVLGELGSRLDSSYLSVILENGTSDGPAFVRTFLPALLGSLGAFAAFYGLCAWRLRGVVLPVRRAWSAVPLTLAALLYVGAAAHQHLRDHDPWGRAAQDVLGHDTGSPFGVISQAWVALDLHLAAARAFEESAGFSFHAVRRAPAARGPELYVLVIGETCRPDRWGLNGYGRDTTPRLGRDPDVVSFDDVVTQAPLTRLSVPMLLTRATPDRQGPMASERSIITAFHEVGFRTAWLSTQEVSSWAGFIHHYAAEADERRYFARRHDEVLLAPFEQVLDGLRDPSDRAFVVLHTMGCHAVYASRYPAAFRVFPDDLPDRRAALNNAYDDGIRYTDWFLAEVIARLRARPDVTSGLLFCGDHGEDLEDDERRVLGHGVGDRYDLPTEALFWPSPALARLRPGAVAAARAHAHAPLSTANVFHSLADLGGLAPTSATGAPLFDPTRSVLDPALRFRPRLFVAQGEVRDYDALFGVARARAASTVAPGLGRAPGGR